MKLGKLKPHEVERNSLSPLSCVSHLTLFLVSISFENISLECGDCVAALEQWVCDGTLYHGQYDSGLVVTPNYCFQNVGGTTHKTLPDT